MAANASDMVEFEWTHVAKLGAPGANAVMEALSGRNTFLKVLKLSNQQLTDVGIAHVAKIMKTTRSITSLDISGNSVTAKGVETIVDSILANNLNVSTSARNSLRILDMSHNLVDFAGCGHLARLITNADSLSVLYLNNNLINDVGLTTIATSLALNCSLKRLDLQQNPASQQAAGIGSVFSAVVDQSNYTLTHLDLSGAKLTDAETIELELSLARNRQLDEERLAAKNHAPPQENAFKRMEIGPDAARLHVFSASVISPTALLRLVVTPLGANVTALVLVNVGLSTLPPQLSLLSNLEELDLRRNRLTALPIEIRNFQRLRRLLLSHNRLQYLPPQLTSVRTLRSLSLHGNPLQWIPQDVVSHPDLEDFPPVDTRLFQFLEETASHADVPDTQLFGKIMVLGQIHSGKTSLCQLLDSETGPNQASKWSQQMPRYLSTEGICARSISIHGSKYAPDSVLILANPDNIAITKKVKFSVLETGGSNIYNASHAIFFRPDLLYLLVVDLTKFTPDSWRETILGLKNTIKTIQTMVGQNHGTAPYIAIVGTFEDQLLPSAVTEALNLLKHHFEAHVLEIVAVSNKSSRGVSILRDRVLFWAWKSKLLSSPRIGAVSAIQRVLRSYSLHSPFISRLELEQICRVYGIEQASEKPDALSSPSNLVHSTSVGSLSTSNRKQTEHNLHTSPTSASMKVNTAISLLESLGAVHIFHHDSQLGVYAFLDIQFIANVFSDVMSAADADGYIYRSHVHPLLWLDCRRHASMHSLFDWCRLFGLTLDCPESHFIVPALLSALPPVTLYNAAWPPIPGAHAAPARPHLISVPSAQTLLQRAVSPDGRMSVSLQASLQREKELKSSNSSPVLAASSLKNPATTSLSLHNSQGANRAAHAASHSTTSLTSLATTPSTLEKTAHQYYRDVSAINSTEWPVLIRGIVTEFVPALVFSHILVAVLSLPNLQRCSWWRNGFIVRRGPEYLKVSREKPANVHQGPSILVQARNDVSYSYSRSLLDDTCAAIDSLLRTWYPQIEFTWNMPWSHPWLPEDETPLISFDSLRSSLAQGLPRHPTIIGNLTIREELLAPELVAHGKYYTTSDSMPSFPQTTASDLAASAVSAHQLPDGGFIRFRSLSEHALPTLALMHSVMQDKAIAPLYGVYLQPPGIAIKVPAPGTLDEVLAKTYQAAPLSWAVRFRIAVDLVLAVRTIHSQVPVFALHGMEASSIFLAESYLDPSSRGTVVQLDLGAQNSASWLSSAYSPRPFAPSAHQLAQSALGLKLSPQSDDIYSLGVLLLQLWRNEPLAEFFKGTLPPVPFYATEEPGFLAFDQLIGSCLVEDPTMRPQVDQIISKISAISVQLKVSHSSSILAANEPTKRWRRVNQVQITASADLPLAIATMCKSTSVPYPKPGVAANLGVKVNQQLDENVVWAGGVDGVLYGLTFPIASSVSNSVSSPPTSPRTNLTASTSPRPGSPPSLLWATLSPSVLENTSVQYRLSSFPIEVRDARKRVVASTTSRSNIWCLHSSATASVLDPSRNALLSTVDTGPCLSICAYDDTVFFGGTSGTVSAFDGSNFKRLRQKDVSNLPITAMVANDKYLWVAMSDDAKSTPATLVCLEMATFQVLHTIQHPMEEIVTAIAMTQVDDSQGSQLLWTGGYSGDVIVLALLHGAQPQKSPEPSINVIKAFSKKHATRIIAFLWDGDQLYSASSDAIFAWKSDATDTTTSLAIPSSDVSSFTVLERSAIITGHKNGCVTVWAAV